MIKSPKNILGVILLMLLSIGLIYAWIYIIKNIYKLIRWLEFKITKRGKDNETT